MKEDELGGAMGPTDQGDKRQVAPPDVFAFLRERFRSYYLPIAIQYRPRSDGRSRLAVFSGFLMVIGGRHVWVTAGHVVADMDRLWTSAELIDRSGFLVDNPVDFGDEASAIPFDPTSCESATLGEDEDDVGVLLLRQYYVRLLEDTSQKRFMPEETWEPGRPTEPVVYYLVGSPAEKQLMDVLPAPEGKIRLRTRVGVACLPLEPVAAPSGDQPDRVASFWDKPDSLFFAIRNDRPEDEGGVDDIAGMSGGPVLASWIAGPRQIDYHLCGIQSGWLKRRRVLRAQGVRTLRRLVGGLSGTDAGPRPS